MLNHDLPTYNLPKRCFNNANIVLMMFPEMTDSTEETDERRFASRASTERPLAKRPASVPVDAGDLPKTCFFGKLWVGKLSVTNSVSTNHKFSFFGKSPFGKLLCTPWNDLQLICDIIRPKYGVSLFLSWKTYLIVSLTTITDSLINKVLTLVWSLFVVRTRQQKWARSRQSKPPAFDRALLKTENK